MAAGEADEAAGLTHGNENHEARSYFDPEKPCVPLSADGIVSCGNEKSNPFVRSGFMKKDFEQKTGVLCSKSFPVLMGADRLSEMFAHGCDLGGGKCLAEAKIMPVQTVGEKRQRFRAFGKRFPDPREKRAGGFDRLPFQVTGAHLPLQPDEEAGDGVSLLQIGDLEGDPAGEPVPKPQQEASEARAFPLYAAHGAGTERNMVEASVAPEPN